MVKEARDDNRENDAEQMHPVSYTSFSLQVQTHTYNSEAVSLPCKKKTQPRMSNTMLPLLAG